MQDFWEQSLWARCMVFMVHVRQMISVTARCTKNFAPEFQILSAVYRSCWGYVYLTMNFIDLSLYPGIFWRKQSLTHRNLANLCNITSQIPMPKTPRPMPMHGNSTLFFIDHDQPWKFDFFFNWSIDPWNFHILFLQ